MWLLGTGKTDECKLKCAVDIAYIPALKFFVQEKEYEMFQRFEIDHTRK